MINTSGIKPVGHRVLILPEKVEETTASGIIVHTASQRMREEMGQINGLVVALGTTAFADQDEPWCKVGDRIIIGKYSGLIYQGTDEQSYRVINDLDVVAVLEKGNAK